ncbi:MAG: CPC_1213 family protein [Clostridiaceae bacterium]
MDNNIKETRNNKKQDGKFKKKNIKHSPQEESSKTAFSGEKPRNL